MIIKELVAATTYGICLSQAIIPDHSRLYPRINFVLGADSKLIKDMFEYGFLNHVCVSDDCRELKELSKKITKAVNDLKRISKTKEMIFIKILTAC